MSVTLEEAIGYFDGVSENLRNDAFNIDTKANKATARGRGLCETADKYHQYAAWLRELVERRKVPEIVRCGECRHRDPEDKKCDCGHDIIWQLPRDDDWYCADAERRTDG